MVKGSVFSWTSTCLETRPPFRRGVGGRSFLRNKDTVFCVTVTHSSSRKQSGRKQNQHSKRILIKPQTMENIQDIRIKYALANCNCMTAVPQHRRSVANCLLRRPSFYPSSGHVGFVVRISSEYLGFCYHFSFHRLFHIHQSPGAGTTAH
jgi:hypothetical protein